MQYENSKLIRNALILTVALLFFGEATGILSLLLLDIKSFAYPWSIFIIIKHGFIGIVAAIGFSLLTFAFGVWGIVIGGFFRYLSSLILWLLILVVVSFIVSMALNEWMNEEPISLYTLQESPNLWLIELFTSLFIVFLPLVLFFQNLLPASKGLGDAQFANAFTIQNAGFFKKEEESLIIGKKYGAPLYSNGFEHVLVFAPSGSGKTRSIAMPNLLNYPYSVVCNDVKFTLFEKTSGYRQNVLGHSCYCFAPTSSDGRTHRYNPLSAISKDKNLRITDIQRIAHILIPDNPKSDPIWTQASRKILKTLLLYLLDSGEHPITLGEVNRLIKQPQFDSWLHEILENTERFDPEFYRNGYSYLNNHEKTRSSILETFSGYFELFDDPIIDTATSASDFDLSQLRAKKMTIYIGFTDEDMERLAPLLTLFWQQLISVMIKEVPDVNKEPYPLLCLIDEFSSLGRIERLRRSLKLLREYRVRCILMIQYIAQTYEKYSHDEARAFTNIKTKIAFATEDIQDAEFISKLLGMQTKPIVNWSNSYQGQTTHLSKNITHQAVPLMRAEEIMKLASGLSLIMRSGLAPIKSSQFIWYQQKVMKNSVLQSIFLPTQKIIKKTFIRVSEKDNY